MAGLLSPGIVRFGPDEARCDGRDEYLRYLQEVHGTITGYQFEVQRLAYSADRRVPWSRSWNSSCCPTASRWP